MKVALKIYSLLIALTFCGIIHAQTRLPVATDSIKILHKGNYGLLIAKTVSDEQYGVIDSNHMVVVPFIYDAIFPFHEELALVYNDDKCGYLHIDGSLRIPLTYTTGNHFKNGKAIVTKNFVSGVINKNNEVIIPFKYNALQTHDHDTYHFQLEPKKSGLMTSQEEIIVQPIYDIMMRRNDSLWIARSNGKFSILNNTGKKINPDAFDELGKKNSASLYRMEMDDKVGFLDDQFNTIIPAQYKRSGPVFGSLLSVHDGTKWGIIDRNNVSISGFIYDQIKYLNDESCIVVKNGKSNIIDQSGNLKLESDCDYIQRIDGTHLIYIDKHIYDAQLNRKTKEEVGLSYGPFSGMHNGMMKIHSTNKLGYMDSLGNMAIFPIYDDGDHFYESGCTAVKQNGKWGFINRLNKQITPITYDSVWHFGSLTECNYIIIKDDLYGYFSKNKVLLEPQFQEIILGEDESLLYRENDKYGIIQENTQEVHKAEYDEIQSHILGYEVKKNGKYGFLDKDLNAIIPIQYEYLEHSGFYIIAKLNGTYRTISEKNELIQAFDYDKIEKKPFDITRTFKNGKVGTLGVTGKELLPPIYDNIRKIDWKNVEVTQGSKTEIINIAKLEMEKESNGNN